MNQATHFSPGLRLPISSMAGLVVVSMFFWLLWTMSHPVTSVSVLPDVPKIEFTRLLTPAEPKPIRDPKAEHPPEVLSPKNECDVGNPGAPGLEDPVSYDELGTRVRPEIPAVGDHIGTILVAINPTYPPRAVTQNIEGWVRVEYTVTASGTTTGIRIVDANPKGVFDRAVIEAVSRWRYAPLVVNGIPTETRGIQKMLRFDLDNAR